MKHIHDLSPRIKTTIAITVFSCAALISFVSHLGSLSVTLPLFIFYVLFLINSYISIKLFFGIIPPRMKSQTYIDLFLAVVYIALAWNFANPTLFAFLLVLFFLFGSMKYVFLIHTITNHPTLIRRKIIANILASTLGLLTLGGILLGYEQASMWGLVIVFALANIFIFFISPLYKLDNIL